MSRYEKVSRVASLFLAALVGVVTVGLVAQAAQRITTPNAMQIPYDLPFNSHSAPITIPVNQPVFVMGADNDFAQNGSFAEGQATMLHNTSDDAFSSIGFDFATSAFFTNRVLPGGGCCKHIFYLDAFKTVDVKWSGTNAIYVFNIDDMSSGKQAPVEHTGVVTMIW